MKTIINSHNHKITNPETIPKERTCDFIDKPKCSYARWAKTYLINNVIYKVALTSTNPRYKKKKATQEPLKPPKTI